ncbi:ABC-type Fe3+-hydroxamate transport system substrate-binding protein [Undibacterium sp. GrIS 1.8]|uniref:helical backbone metal receptor n=1 Tax=Undibacterium sp. GrIS 1.8 TaxID=3143934 RepID=UPI0033957E0A
MPLIDAMGQAHLPADANPRIVSLVPSITELLCDLRLASWLVGRTGFCIHPADIVKTIPKIGGTKDVNIEKIRRLAPTHLIVNIDENQKPTVDQLAAFIPHIVVTHPITPRDNLVLYRLLGDIFQVAPAAEKLCTEFEKNYAQLDTKPDTKLAPLTQTARPQTMLYCIWKDPWMTVSNDTYIANMLSLIGWRTWQHPQSTERYPRFEWSDQVASEIDGVLLSTEPYRFTEIHVDALEQQIGKPVQLVDGEMLSWYGSRAIAGLAYLRSL